MTPGKKLIEVALPMSELNDASAYDKMPGIGIHPKNIHLWWARLPLPAARVVLFASLVDDPSDNPRFSGLPLEAQAEERRRLLAIVESLLTRDASSLQRAYATAHEEIRACCGDDLPPILDPFSGGGSIPLEAQRLGLQVIASDLNPIAVALTRGFVEIPYRFKDQPPVNPTYRRGGRLSGGKWEGSRGLAEDIQYYGELVNKALVKRATKFYPDVEIPKDLGGGKSPVISWLWARTVTCPNPACRARMPLVSTFWLSTRKGKGAWIIPEVKPGNRSVRFRVQRGEGSPPDPPKTGRGAKFRCLVCNEPAGDQHIKDEASAGRMGTQLLAMVAEGKRGRIYLDPSADQETIAKSAKPAWVPDEELPYDPRFIWCTIYGLKHHRDLYTERQLLALTTLTDEILAISKQVRDDALRAGLTNDLLSLEREGTGALAYSQAIALYLGFALDRLADYNCALSTWKPSGEQQLHVFCRQALPMVWDFAESNVLGRHGITWLNEVKYVSESVATLLGGNPGSATVSQLDVAADRNSPRQVVLNTDPPYYDNMSYANLSDFFYIWLRRLGRTVYPQLFSTLLTPKDQELIATPYRFSGSREQAKQHFEEGFRTGLSKLIKVVDPRFPAVLYYAFKQDEDVDLSTQADETTFSHGRSTGWETFLTALLTAGFQVTATWPIRASQRWRMVAAGTNALATYIVIACRPRLDSAPLATRLEFVRALKKELPSAIKTIQQGGISAVDLPQASIGPGMAIFSRYSRVIEAGGTPMTVGSALQLINQTLDEVLDEQETEFDPETRWCRAWFEQFGTGDGPFGTAESLSKAKNTATKTLESQGLIISRGGKVRLVSTQDMPTSWDPSSGSRISIWKAAHELIGVLRREGEQAAATLLRRIGGIGDPARDLAYRLYSICERKGWSKEGIEYNALVVAWPEITRLRSSGIEQFGTTEAV